MGRRCRYGSTTCAATRVSAVLATIFFGSRFHCPGICKLEYGLQRQSRRLMRCHDMAESPQRHLANQLGTISSIAREVRPRDAPHAPLSRANKARRQGLAPCQHGSGSSEYQLRRFVAGRNQLVHWADEASQLPFLAFIPLSRSRQPCVSLPLTPPSLHPLTPCVRSAEDGGNRSVASWSGPHHERPSSHARTRHLCLPANPRAARVARARPSDLSCSRC